MDKIIVKENFTHWCNPEIKFTKGEIFFGTWNYVSNIDKTQLPDLCVICNEFRGPFLINKENLYLLS